MLACDAYWSETKSHNMATLSDCVKLIKLCIEEEDGTSHAKLTLIQRRLSDNEVSCASSLSLDKLEQIFVLGRSEKFQLSNHKSFPPFPTASAVAVFIQHFTYPNFILFIR